MSTILELFKTAFIPAEFNALGIVTLVFRILTLISCAALIIFFGKYLIQYRVFEGFWAKLTGNMHEYDRIKRQQLKKDIAARENSFSKEKTKMSFIGKIYALITASGIIETVPGFSESAFLATLAALTLVIFTVVSFFRNAIIGLVFAAVFLLITWYTLDLIAYNRKMKLEKQLLQFTNACASASLQYSNIIDIFGAIYDQFESPLREGLEACYVEAKSDNDKEAAIKHLQEKYNSSQFNFVIDNLQLCSSVTGDYYSVSRDISETISIYSQSHEKKRTLLRNAKVNISLMFVVALGILYSLSIFVGGIWNILFNTTVGNIVGLGLIVVFFYGMNLKTEK